jgi:hypothetical protein
MTMDFATRYDFLKMSIARYDGYYNLAAVKASLLLTSNAIFLAPALGEKGQLLGIVGASGAVRVLIAVSALASLVSIAFAALVIASFLPGAKRHFERPSLAFTESVARIATEDYAKGIAELDEASVLADLSRLSHLLAASLSSKFRYVNISLSALVIAVISAFSALLV